MYMKESFENFNIILLAFENMCFYFDFCLIQLLMFCSYFNIIQYVLSLRVKCNYHLFSL